MNVLFVDDDAYVLEDIQASLDFEFINANLIFTAANMNQAKDIIVSNPIHVVVSDIDMPGGSGLELLSYIKENHEKIQTIFITCHADFSFAQKAIKLGCLDYLLKPLDYGELASIIKLAEKRICEQNESEELSLYRSYWFKHQPRLIEQFWLDLIRRKIPPESGAIKAESEKRNIPFQEDIKYLPVLSCVQYDCGDLSLDDTIISFGINNIGKEFLADNGNAGHFFDLSNRYILAIFPVNSGDDAKSILAKLNEFVAMCHAYLNCNLSCYADDPIKIDKLADTVDALIKLDESNVAYFNNVFHLHKSMTNMFAPPYVDMTSWGFFIKNGYSAKIISEIDHLFQYMTENKLMTASFLEDFQQDFLQILYTVLDEKGIKAHNVLESEDVRRLYDGSTKSTGRLLLWISGVLKESDEYFEPTDKNGKQIIDTVNFIQRNLFREISREEIANNVYLHPDYLDRLFKKKYSLSVSKYMTNEKIKLSKTLLTETEISVSDIASQLGYNNISNFSAMFRKATGENPSEYRRHKKGG